MSGYCSPAIPRIRELVSLSWRARDIAEILERDGFTIWQAYAAFALEGFPVRMASAEAEDRLYVKERLWRQLWTTFFDRAAAPGQPYVSWPKTSANASDSD